MKSIIVLILFMSSPSFALRGLYGGLRGGSVSPTSSNGIAQGTGYGLDFNFRLTKAYDLSTTFQTSSHAGEFSSKMAGAGIEVRMFRGMADMELYLGVGAGGYSLTIAEQSDFKFGVNAGITLDFVLSRAVHLGTQVRFHSFAAAPTYGSGFQTFMVRLGYFYGMADKSLTLPDMN